MKNKFTKILIIIILLLIVLFIWRHRGDFSSFRINQKQLVEKIRSHGPVDIIILVALIIIVIMVPGAPTAPFEIASGIVLGPIFGSVLNVTAAVLGNALLIWIISKFKISSSSDKNKILGKLENMNNPKMGLSIAYMIPVIPTFLIDYTVDKLGYSLKKFLPYIVIGNIPISILYAVGGDAILEKNYKKIIVLLAIILIILGLFLLFNKLYKQERSEDNE
ncbi:VTT domain-containing protein [Floricoccus penangensis]|uniref:VTT domain-containing protein n=1 Tax=Floricoccus penangensis TaxID=1859475 RepID=UPI0009F199FA|nr:VTT domain-containing protein [Floricoccus penangensis]